MERKKNNKGRKKYKKKKLLQRDTFEISAIQKKFQSQQMNKKKEKKNSIFFLDSIKLGNYKSRQDKSRCNQRGVFRWTMCFLFSLKKKKLFGGPRKES